MAEPGSDVRYWWGIVVMARKIIVVFAIVLSKPMGPVVQSQLVILIFIVFGFAHVYALPYMPRHRPCKHLVSYS